MFDEISVRYYHSRSKQRTDQRVLVLSLKFLALIKTGFSPCKKYSPFFFYFCLPLLYATFQFGPYNIFKKKIELIFYPWKLKKTGLKSCSYPFFTVQPSPQPKIDFSYQEISGPDICSHICVFFSLKYQNILRSFVFFDWNWVYWDWIQSRNFN